MNLSRPLVLAAAILSVPIAHAQQAPAPVGSPLITDVYFPVGFHVSGTPLMTTTDWRNLMPSSELLKNDLSWDQHRGDLGRNVEGGANLEAAIGLDLGRKNGADARFDKQLRVGVSFLAPSSMYRRWDRSSTGRYDTLTSSLNGQVSYVDTTRNESYAATYRFTKIGLNASYILRKRTPGKWSWYVGFGVMAGTTLNASASVTHRIHTSASNSNSNYPELQGWDSNVESEEMHVASTGWGAAYALAGIDLRLGRTHPFWSSVHLFNEWRPTMMFTTVPGSRLSSTGAIQNLFGLRLDLR